MIVFRGFEIVPSENQQSEIIVALLNHLVVHSIWEKDDLMIAYFDAEMLLKDGLDDQSIYEFLHPFAESVKEIKILNKNWNEEWEKKFKPVEVDEDCFIYADFHEKKSGFNHYIKIAPKMAFGTGHHETTFMMIQTLAEIEIDGKSVLDIGCGSGILSIYAGLSGANSISAIDHELPSYENTLEHSRMNNIELKAQHGGIEDLPNRTFDVVLANINREVLIRYSDEIIQTVGPNGILLLSGILERDLYKVQSEYDQLKHISTKQKGNWLCLKYSRK